MRAWRACTPTTDEVMTTRFIPALWLDDRPQHILGAIDSWVNLHDTSSVGAAYFLSAKCMSCADKQECLRAGQLTCSRVIAFGEQSLRSQHTTWAKFTFYFQLFSSRKIDCRSFCM